MKNLDTLWLLKEIFEQDMWFSTCRLKRLTYNTDCGNEMCVSCEGWLNRISSHYFD